MYHHFPGGKEQIGVNVINDLTAGLIGLFTQSRARSAHALMLQAGEQMVVVAERPTSKSVRCTRRSSPSGPHRRCWAKRYRQAMVR